MKRTGFLAAIVLLAWSCSDSVRSPQLVEAVDLTNDLYHRTQAGYLMPDREPVVVQVIASEGRAPDSEYFRFRSELGSLWIRPDSRGQVVAYMDPQMYFGHWVVACTSTSARIFEEWPQHPLGY